MACQFVKDFVASRKAADRPLPGPEGDLKLPGWLAEEKEIPVWLQKLQKKGIIFAQVKDMRQPTTPVAPDSESESDFDTESTASTEEAAPVRKVARSRTLERSGRSEDHAACSCGQVLDGFYCTKCEKRVGPIGYVAGPRAKAKALARVETQKKPDGFVQGFPGRLCGFIIGQTLFPLPVFPNPAVVACANAGHNLATWRGKKRNTVYLVPEDVSTLAEAKKRAVKVELWQLGRTAPLTDSGLQLVLEARDEKETAEFLKRALRKQKLLVPYGRRKEFKSYVANFVTESALDVSLTTALEELQEREIVATRTLKASMLAAVPCS
jgi:hypothetical protein